MYEIVDNAIAQDRERMFSFVLESRYQIDGLKNWRINGQRRIMFSNYTQEDTQNRVFDCHKNLRIEELLGQDACQQCDNLAEPLVFLPIPIPS